MTLFLPLAFALSCQNYTARCECFPAVPFEGYKIYVVETCDGKEEWSTSYDAPAFDTAEACRRGAETYPVCVSLAHPSRG